MDDSNQRLLQLLADGSTYFDAATELHVTDQTIYKRLSQLRARLGAKTTTHLVAIALRQHLIR